MQFANRFNVIRNSDHFVLKFASQFSEGDPETAVAEFAIPLTLGFKVALGLFEAALRSVFELNAQMTGLNAQMQSLNKLGEEIQAEAARQQAAKKT